MQIKKLSEEGYIPAMIGFSLSYNSTLDRAQQLLPIYAHKNIGGENKFLRSIMTWWDITAPRFWLTELDTYKVATVRLSESTMHTITKKPLTRENFEYHISQDTLEELNQYILAYKKETDSNQKAILFRAIKNALPEGFLQRSIFTFNYATLREMYIQRKNHRLEQWQMFLKEMLAQVEYPKFIKENYNESN